MKLIRNRIAPLTAGVVLINFLVVALLALSVHESHVQYEEQATISARNLAQVLDEDIKGIFDRVDLTLLSVTDETERQIKSGGIHKQVLNAYISHQLEKVPELDSLRMTDANGDVLYGSGVVPGINIADRDYFYYQRDASSKTLTISMPYLSRITGKWQISISRRISKPDGSFNGIAYGNFMLDYFTGMFSGINVGTHGSIAMWNSDLELIARFPNPRNEAGLKLRSEAFNESIRVSREKGSYTTLSNVDKIERTFCYRKISKYPIYILVGLATQDYLAQWQKEAIKKSALGVSFVLLSAFFTVLFYRYLTDSKRAEEALYHSEERLRLALAAASQGLYDLNVQTGEAIVSDEYAMILGYDPKEFHETNAAWIARLHPDDRDRVAETHRSYVRGDIPEYAVEFRQRTKSGDWKWILSLGRIVDQDAEGNPLRMLGTHTDITERKRAEAEKEKLQEQLLQAQKMEAIGQLAGGIAHDFNNILTAIIGYASLLKTNLGAESSLRVYAEQILSSAEKSADLTRQLLAFSRKQIMNITETDLNSLIKGIEKLLHRLIGEDVDLKTSLTDERLIAMVDPSQIEQVLLNLSTNARDAMPCGGSLTISTRVMTLNGEDAKTHNLSTTGRYALISVTDTGIGLDEVSRKRIFEPFYTTKEIGKGTGLGLAIVYGIIKGHNGHITVHSEPGEGTTFNIYLPVIESPSESTREKEDFIPRGGRETILVAEDNNEVRTLISQVLQEAGYEVIESVDGEEAISKFETNRDSIALAILDVIMPGKSGKETFKAIRKIKPGVRVLFTSGYTSDIITKAGIEESGAHFMWKPLTPVDLLRKVRALLDK